MRFFQNTPMAIATVDQQGRDRAVTMRASPRLRRRAQGRGRRPSILSVVAERDRGALEAAIRKAAEGQGDIAPVEAALAGGGER